MSEHLTDMCGLGLRLQQHKRPVNTDIFSLLVSEVVLTVQSHEVTEHALKTGATLWRQEEDLRDAEHFHVLFQNVRGEH